MIYLQIIKTEAAVNYAVSMSCVMGNRLCLNVRGMVWHDDEIVITHSFQFGRSKGHATQPSSSRNRWPVMVTASTEAPCPTLNEFEMDELRNMRVDPEDLRTLPLAFKDHFATANKAFKRPL